MKGLIWFFLGAGAGALTAYLILNRRYMDSIEDEIEAIQEYYEEKLKSTNHTPASQNNKKDVESEKAIEKTKEIIRYNRYSSTGSLTKIAEAVLDPLKGSSDDAAKAANANTEEEEDEDDEPSEYDIEMEDVDPETLPPPYLITAGEFGEIPGYDIETLYFYEENGVMLDDAECFVDNCERILGEDALSCFDEDDRTYVRNERNMTDYEIVCYHCAYEE